MSTHTIKLHPFQTPNFALPIVAPRGREEGPFNPAAAPIPLSELSPYTLDEMCREFRAAIFAKAGKPDTISGR